MMEHVLMDERGNTKKASVYSSNKRSVLAYSLFALMFVMGGIGAGIFVKNMRHGPSPAASFTPFLSAPQAGFGGKCTIIPDAEDFAACTTGYENTAEAQVLRCPSGYGNIEVQKVRDGETGKKNYRDMALLRHFCKGLDACKLTMSELRANDDGMPLDSEPLPEEEELEPELDAEAIIEDVAGVDSNGHVLMKHHGHHHHNHNHPGQVKVYYECEKLQEGPFEALETFFEDMLGPGELTIEEVEPVEIGNEEIGTEEIGTEEVPILLSKKHKNGKCGRGLKNIAQDWDAGTVCGTIDEELVLGCDSNRADARIFVLSVHAKTPHNHVPGATQNSDPVIEDSQSSVEEEPFLAKRGGHKHNKNGKSGHKQGKHLGLQLTDICTAQEGDCSVVLSTALGDALTQSNPAVDETTPMHVKYMCSYAHQEN